LAERILTIGGKPAHTFADYLSVSGLKELDDISDGKKVLKPFWKTVSICLGSFVGEVRWPLLLAMKGLLPCLVN
jgi:starvation-inducible DNA-binding protein